MSYRVVALLVALALALGSAVATTQLVLRDGRIIEGTNVRRDGGEYVVELEAGDTIVVPTELVDEVRLIEESVLPPAVVESEPSVIAGRPAPEGPSGIRRAQPETLAGARVAPPVPAEQLAVLGPAAEFRPSVVGNDWRPSTDWNLDPREQNDFNRSTWTLGPVDPSWNPRSAWDDDKDVLAHSRSTWSENIIDNRWTPTEGFAEFGARR